jgi:CheY-like chemotaxis protein
MQFKANMLQTNVNKELERLLVPGILESKKIVVAEDDETNFFLIKEFLGFSKAEIIWARNGAETLKLVEANNPVDIVLLDIQMPEMSGFEVLQVLKRLYLNLPVIAITAYAVSGDREAGMKAGFDEYLAKPVSRKTLMENIMKFIS